MRSGFLKGSILGWLAAVLFVSLSIVAPRAAHAGDVAAARRHFEHGQRLYATGKYADAAVEFKKAYDDKHAASIVFNLAQSLRLAGEDDEALDWYERYVSDYPKGPDIKEAEHWVETLTSSGGGLEMAPASAPVAPASVPASIPTPAKVAAASVPASQPFAAGGAEENPVAGLSAGETGQTQVEAHAGRPFYERAWFWGGTGAVVAAGIVVGVLEATRPAIPPGTPGSALGNQMATFH